ncbi:hypothetical protein ACFL4V_01540 [Candidatus Latescibacterota bacterium]
MIKNISGNDTKKVSARNLNKQSDSVELSGAATDKNMDETSFVVETEFQPRAELIESVSGRVSDEEYNSPDVLENIAEKLIDADVATDIISDIRENQMDSEEIEEINNNIANNYYDNQDVIQEIASKIIDVIDLSSLFVNDSNR